MTVISSNTLTDFVIFQLTKTTSCLLYSSGAKFEGPIKDNQAFGYGKFSWPHDEYFEGFYLNGLRHKIGFQKWYDGDVYKGEFYNDKRHGWGIYKWSNNDRYEGSFYQDSRHGFGTYTSNNNNRFVGTFYNNKREGFGTMFYTNGDIFQGIYKDNYRCGPGIMTYSDGRQDIGLWHRNSLLKLIVKIEEVFSVQQFDDLISIYSNQSSEYLLNDITEDLVFNNTQYSLDSFLKYKLTKPLMLSVLKNNIDDSTKSQVTFSDNSEKENLSEDLISIHEEKHRYDENDRILQNDSLNEIQLSFDEIKYTIEQVNEESIVDPHLDDTRKEFIQTDLSISNFLTKLNLSDNTVPLMKKIIDHLKRFSSYIPNQTEESKLSNMVNVVRDVVSNILYNFESTAWINRTQIYSAPGDFEIQSENLINLSHFGNLNEIQKLLTNSVAYNVNVTDCFGSFALLEATLTWDKELINYLLDCGANINQITDEGMSALGSCMLFYYPKKIFIETIAESVVKLNQTPLNYNGVRREPMKKLNSIEISESNKSASNNSQGFKSSKLLEKDSKLFLTENNDEEWNSYQKVSINLDLDISSQPPTVRIIPKNKFFEDKSTNFDSYRNCLDYPIKINDNLVDKAASILSSNSMIINRQPRPNSCYQEISNDEGVARSRALKISRCNVMLEVIRLLLRRGADPNVCQVPFSSIFFSVKSGDIEMTKLLISKGANTNASLRPGNGSLTLLHISSCLPGKVGIAITELLLQSGAKPNARALQDESFLDKTLIDEWSKDNLTEEQKSLMGGKTPLHLTCSRYDDFKVSHIIAKLLLDHGADPNLLCNGHSPLTLAIASGNDLIVDEILNSAKLNINLSLTHGLGNALCVASSTTFEHTRTLESRLNLIKKLISSKADLLSPVPIGFKRAPGIVIDYAYYIFNLDQRVAHLPYHALTSIERDLFNNRRAMLSHLGMFTRENAVEKEKLRLEIMKLEGIKERSPSPDFMYTGAGAEVASVISKASKHLTNMESQMQGSELLARKPLLIYCYECGRSANVKLTACTRCKEVYFCSKLCKTKAWTARHKSECLRVGGRVSSAESTQKNNRNVDSPTPTTFAEDPKIAQDIAKTRNQIIIKKDPSQLKEKNNQEYLQFNTQIKNSYLSRRLPPLNYHDHPSYSYAYVMGQYVKIDNLGRILTLDQNLMDNYSFE